MIRSRPGVELRAGVSALRDFQRSVGSNDNDRPISEMVKESLSRASMVEMVTEHKKRLLLFVLETSTLVPLFPARSFRGPFFIGLAFLTTTRASPLVQGHNNQIADDSGPAKALILLVRRTKGKADSPPLGNQLYIVKAVDSKQPTCNLHSSIMQPAICFPPSGTRPERDNGCNRATVQIATMEYCSPFPNTW